jgi:hypothetical protein
VGRRHPGRRRLGQRLNELADDRLRVLHDRRIPGSRANIDHLAVTPTGVYVIDAKKYRGRPHLKVEGELLRPRVEKLLVGSRNCTPVVDGVIKQVAIVRDLLDSSTPVHGVLCFVEADWPLIGGSFTTRGVEALRPKKLYPKLRSDGPLDAETVAGLHRALAAALKPAYANEDIADTRLLEDSGRSGVWRDSDQVFGGWLSIRLPT